MAPNPFNQGAVYENAGFIFMLSKEIWDRHPCCAFAISQEFAQSAPNTLPSNATSGWKMMTENAG